MKSRLIVLLAGIILLAGCSVQAGGKSDTIVFADAQWDSIQVHNHIAGKIVEEGYGYDTEIISASTAATMQGVRQGDIQVYLEVWTDNFPDLYAETIESGEAIKVSVNFDDNAQGIYVPRYVIEGDEERGIEPMAPDLRRLEDIKNYPEVFEDPEDPGRGRLINAPSGWVIDEVIDQKFDTYGLHETFNNFMPGSDAAIITSLAAAYEKGEAWVGYYWEPTAVTAKYDLVLLEEDPYDEEVFNETGGTAFPSMEVVVLVNSDFHDQSPEIVEFLSNYETSSALTEAPLEYMDNHDATAEEAALWWLEEYEEIWTEWVPEDIAAKVKDSL